MFFLGCTRRASRRYVHLISDLSVLVLTPMRLQCQPSLIFLTTAHIVPLLSSSSYPLYTYPPPPYQGCTISTHTHTHPLPSHTSSCPPDLQASGVTQHPSHTWCRPNRAAMIGRFAPVVRPYVFLRRPTAPSATLCPIPVALHYHEVDLAVHRLFG